MYNIVGDILLTTGNPHFGTGYLVTAIGQYIRLGTNIRKRRASLSLRQTHGAKPFPSNQLGQILILELIRAAGIEHISHALSQK